MRIVSAKPMPAKRPFTILCVDDEQPGLKIRAAVLESVGYRVFAAMTRQAAMDVFVAEEIDLVLADHMLRGASGAELAVFMKQVRPDVSVVLLSGSTYLPWALVKHVDACVEKGGPTQDLLDCLEGVLAKQSRGRAATDRMAMEA